VQLCYPLSVFVYGNIHDRLSLPPSRLYPELPCGLPDLDLFTPESGPVTILSTPKISRMVREELGGRQNLPRVAEIARLFLSLSVLHPPPLRQALRTDVLVTQRQRGDVGQHLGDGTWSGLRLTEGLSECYAQVLEHSR
jgi:hypothetical protein